LILTERNTHDKGKADDRLDKILSETRALYEIELDRVKGLDDKLVTLIGISGVSLTLLLGTFGDMLVRICTVTGYNVLSYKVGLSLLVLSGLTPLFFLVVRSTLPKPGDVKLLIEREDIQPVSFYAAIYSAVWSSARRSGDWKAKGLIAGLVLYICGLLALASLALILL